MQIFYIYLITKQLFFIFCFVGTKTYTLFAPTDRAFVGLNSDELTKLITDKELARDLVTRHIISGTLFTNGMRYYQLKDTLEPDKQIAISKSTSEYLRLIGFHFNTLQRCA